MEGDFPSCCKQAKVVSLEKPKKIPDEDQTCKPICLLNSLGKLYEHLILGRLNTEIERTDDLAPNQFDFRKSRSTLQAVKKYCRSPKRHREPSRKWLAMVTVDVKNVFSSASWECIISKLQERDVHSHILNCVARYLANRKVTVDGKTMTEVSAGVPQGSILGPTLWNVAYDDIIEIAVPEITTLICYAVDLAILVQGENENQLIFHVEAAFSEVKF